MPCLLIHTNVAVSDQTRFLSRCSSEVAAALGKPESYVLIELNDNKAMMFAGSDAPLAFLELKSLGLTNGQTADLSARLCAFIQSELGIDPARVYIEFVAPERTMFGWNGGTF
ncbi:MAG: phenylpyruvate tautomerase MIF-related protein [Mariprofundus sp.]|nr:phenylpyruvate tautomerase MIF-related protein [Mariprofundus sp.]